MPSNHLILCCPLLLPSIFLSMRIFSNESVLRIRWPKYWSFSISPFNEYSGLISFRIDWFDLLAVQGTLRVFSNTTFHKCKFFSAILYLLGIYCLESPLECVLQKHRVFVLFIPNAEYPEMDMVYRRNVITGCMKEWIHADIHMMSLEICL